MSSSEVVSEPSSPSLKAIAASSSSSSSSSSSTSSGPSSSSFTSFTSPASASSSSRPPPASPLEAFENHPKRSPSLTVAELTEDKSPFVVTRLDRSIEEPLASPSSSSPSSAQRNLLSTMATTSTSTSSSLASAPVEVVPASVSSTSLSLASVMALIEVCAQKESFKDLSSTFFEVFKKPAVLNASFLTGAATAEIEATRPLSILDLSEVQEFYSVIVSIGGGPLNSILYALNTRLTAGLSALASASSSSTGVASYFTSPHALTAREFLIHLHNPLLAEESSAKLLKDLLTLGRKCLEPPVKDAVGALWRSTGTPTAPTLRDLLTLLEGHITARMNEDSATGVGESDLEAAALLIDEVWKINKERGGEIPLDAFYNKSLSDNLDVRADFIAWKEVPRVKFTFCLYPYLLDAEYKSRVMQFESIVQMNHEIRSAYASHMMGVEEVSPYLVLQVHRNNVIPDALSQLSYREGEYKKKLKVVFVGEEGIDQGGPAKEFFQIIVRNLFDPNYGMFVEDPETRSYFFSPSSLETGEEYELIGTLLGLAIYNQIILDLRLPLVIYKRLAGMQPTLQDLKEAMPVMGRNLEYILKYPGDVADLALSFEYTYEALFERHVVQLLPPGPDGLPVRVTNENRQQFVDLYVEHVLVKGVESAYRAFERGFMKVCGGDAIKLFSPEELELLVCGSPELDFYALQDNTELDGYEPNAPVIGWFWEVVHELTLEEKKKLLFFTTGSDRAPIKGLGSLKFVITREGPDSDRLPQAHTCFNHLMLPQYSSKEKLRERLLAALQHSESFGML